MSLIIRSFWLVLISALTIGVLALGFVGIPVKPSLVTKIIPLDKLPTS